MTPQKEQAVAERDHLYRASKNGHEDIRLDREHIILQRDVFELLLPASQLGAVFVRDAEALDCVEVVEGFDLKVHHFRGHLADFFIVFPLL